MKFRTDFVTNSSSSSFVVEITLQDMNGKNYSVQIPPDDPDGMCNADLNCSAASIMNVSSVEELIELLASSADAGYEVWDEEEEEEEEEEDSWDPNAETREAMQEFGDSVKQGITDLSHIKEITLERNWCAWGEAATCFGYNINACEDELADLAEKVCQSEGEEKETAILDMLALLSNYPNTFEGGWSDTFPTGFLGGPMKTRIQWKNYAGSIEELAKMIVDEETGDIGEVDQATETTVIDMQTHTISQKAEYFFPNKNGENN